MSAPISHELKDKLRAAGPIKVASQPPVKQNVLDPFSFDGSVIESVGGNKKVAKIVLGSEQAAQKAQTQAQASPTEVKGNLSVEVPKVADTDPLINNAVPSAGQLLSEEALQSGGQTDGSTMRPEDDMFTDEKIELTEDDRNAFLDSLVSGVRYERPFALFNGRVTGKLRCRSVAESEALGLWMNAGIREGRYESTLDYSLDMRNALLTAQVLELNGTRYPELAAPLYRTKIGDKVEDPGWLAAAKAWSDLPEPVIAAVYEELRMFERKYWTMIAHSRDQNFWHPAESI